MSDFKATYGTHTNGSPSASFRDECNNLWTLHGYPKAPDTLTLSTWGQAMRLERPAIEWLASVLAQWLETGEIKEAEEQ